MNKIPLSVVILTKNEEKNIAECLESVYNWADEIIVIDDESRDNTLEIVRKFTNRVFTRKMDIEGCHRNWAYKAAKNPWVLSLDADERVSPQLQIEISRIINDPNDYSGFAIPRRNFIGRYWVKYGGWYPSAQLKLFRKDRFRYEEVEVHPRAFLDGKCGLLKSDIIHYSYKDIEDFLAKLNRQTSLEATKWINSNRKMSLGHALWRAVDRFFRRFLGKKGYKDGWPGFVVAFFDSVYQIVSYSKYREFKSEKKDV
ncbi:MAG: glycosyltransferase family 2 protein [Candidatus Omnitrophota bacterium]